MSNKYLFKVFSLRKAFPWTSGTSFWIFVPHTSSFQGFDGSLFSVNNKVYQGAKGGKRLNTVEGADYPLSLSFSGVRRHSQLEVDCLQRLAKIALRKYQMQQNSLRPDKPQDGDWRFKKKKSTRENNPTTLIKSIKSCRKNVNTATQ